MGKRQTELLNVLCKGGFTFTNKPKIDKEMVLDSPFYDELFKVYKNLGGILDEIPNRYTSFDIITEEGIIELDEERHFNQYRQTTLNSSIYENLSNLPFNTYQELCTSKQDICLKTASHGKNWTSKSTEKQFGKSSTKGDLTTLGSSRWKQRAFYDFIKDSLNLIFPKILLVRFSIYEVVDEKTINDILNKKLIEYYPALSLKILERIKGIK